MLNEKIGIFGGTFDPIHNGHINLVLTYKKALGLDKIIVVPAKTPPHKIIKSRVSENDRFEMVKLAFEPFDFVYVSDIELKKEGKNYTVDTVIKLKEQFSESELFLIIGSDMFLYFDKWFEYKKIMEMCKICTMPRENNEMNELIDFQEKLDHELKNTIILDETALVVSSSDIRERLKLNKSVDDLIPEKVRNYIFEKGLYIND